MPAEGPWHPRAARLSTSAYRGVSLVCAGVLLPDRRSTSRSSSRAAVATAAPRIRAPRCVETREWGSRGDHTLPQRESLFTGARPRCAGREFHRCSLGAVGTAAGFTVAGLFAGIGGIERGLAAAGGHAELLCENWEPANAVLAERFPDVPLVGDVRDLQVAAEGRRRDGWVPVHRPVAGRADAGHPGQGIGSRRRGVPSLEAQPSRPCCSSRTCATCSSSTGARRCGTWSPSLRPSAIGGRTDSSTLASPECRSGGSE